MNRTSVEIVAFMPPPSQSGEKPPMPFWMSLAPFVFVFFIFYALFIRPQQKRAKDHARLLAKLKVGDKVTTSGGIVGTVVSLKDKTVALRSADTKMEVLKSAVSEVAGKDSNQTGGNRRGSSSPTGAVVRGK